jgi:hypothetical protein
VFECDLSEVNGVEGLHGVIGGVFERIEECGGRGLYLERPVAVEAVRIDLIYDFPAAFAGSEVRNDRVGLFGA